MKERQFVEIRNGIIDEQTSERGSGLYFLYLGTSGYENSLEVLKRESEHGICAYLNEDGQIIRESVGSFKKIFMDRPMDTRFILFIRKTPFLRNFASYYLAKTEHEGVYEIIPANDERCPEQAFSILVQVRHHPLLDD